MLVSGKKRIAKQKRREGIEMVKMKEARKDSKRSSDGEREPSEAKRARLDENLRVRVLPVRQRKVSIWLAYQMLKHKGSTGRAHCGRENGFSLRHVSCVQAQAAAADFIRHPWQRGPQGASRRTST